VKELPLDVEDVVFSGLASAQVVLTQHEKDLGALVIDMGGGTTDYVLYSEGAVRQSGCLAWAAITSQMTSPWVCASRWRARKN
jgi:cell division protein FtsA